MNKTQTIAVQTESDIFTARMQVRELARAIGFDLTNQARVAQATSSLARALRLGKTQQGQVVIDCLNRDECLRVRVACTTANNIDFKAGTRAFRDVQWLVDELAIEELTPDRIRVTFCFDTKIRQM